MCDIFLFDILYSEQLTDCQHHPYYKVVRINYKQKGNVYLMRFLMETSTHLPIERAKVSTISR